MQDQDCTVNESKASSQPSSQFLPSQRCVVWRCHDGRRFRLFLLINSGRFSWIDRFTLVIDSRDQ